ncbi:MAG: FHA domain-containing protein [Ruminococcus sp.]|nr:FHA domain-containing protein [Ruminococcus sp.]
MNFFEKIKLKNYVSLSDSTLRITLGNKEKINAKLFETIKNNRENGFADISRVKEKSKNLISYDIRGLRPLSEHIKTTILQDNYNRLLLAITDAADIITAAKEDICTIIFDPRYAYCDPVKNTIQLTVIPVYEPHCFGSLPELLHTLHKHSNIIVSDGILADELERFLETELTKHKKDPRTLFDTKKLRSILLTDRTSSVSDSREDTPSPRSAPTVLLSENRSGTATVLLSENKPSPSDTYIEDENGNRHYINRFPFRIGRCTDGNDLTLCDIPEVSGFHACITYEGGCCFIEDLNSTNGTFVSDGTEVSFRDESRIKKAILSDNTSFYLYKTKFTFHTDDQSSPTCIISSSDSYQSSSTIPLDENGEYLSSPSDYCAYIVSSTGSVTAYISVFPFSSGKLSGIRIEKALSPDRPVYSIINNSSSDITVEGEALKPGAASEIFSGCSFFIENIEYTFFIKN